MAVAKKRTPSVKRQTGSKSESGSKIRTKSNTIPESTGVVHHQETKAVYRLLQGTEDTIQIVKSSHVLGYDEKNDEYRFMRYCTNQPTIWEDEQTEPFQRQRIVIEGEKVVSLTSRTGRLLADILDKHPSNAANGGSLFKRIDAAKDAADDVSQREMMLDMQYKIKELSATSDGEQKLRDVGLALGFKAAANNNNISVLKSILYGYVEDYKNAVKFNEKLNDRASRALSLVQQAYSKGKLEYKNSEVRWTGSEEAILKVPAGKDWQSHFAANVASSLHTELWEELEVAAK